MPLLAGAVGQSLSTRPDIIGSDISKVRQNISSFLILIDIPLLELDKFKEKQ